jgi:hypothetical protein
MKGLRNCGFTGSHLRQETAGSGTAFERLFASRLGDTSTVQEKVNNLGRFISVVKSLSAVRELSDARKLSGERINLP